MKTNKDNEFTILILDILNAQIFMISEYAMNNYKNFSRFFLESFLNEARKLAKDKQPVNFFLQLELIKEMTNKITSKRIEERWK